MSPSASTQDLAVHLTALPDREVAALLVARPDLAAPPSSSFLALATRAGVQGSVEQALAGPTAPPGRAGAPLAQFVATARAWGARALAEHYVETFDRRRRCCLYLTYYAVGDTRHRGAAILAFKQALAAAGYEMTCGELPDYLPVVLELSARSDDEIARVLLASHREGIEVLRSALVDVGSPYARLVEAVSMTLPRIDAATADRVRALVAAGPPARAALEPDVLSAVARNASRKARS